MSEMSEFFSGLGNLAKSQAYLTSRNLERSVLVFTVMAKSLDKLLVVRSAWSLHSALPYSPSSLKVRSPVQVICCKTVKDAMEMIDDHITMMMLNYLRE